MLQTLFWSLYHVPNRYDHRMLRMYRCNPTRSLTFVGILIYLFSRISHFTSLSILTDTRRVLVRHHFVVWRPMLTSSKFVQDHPRDFLGKTVVASKALESLGRLQLARLSFHSCWDGLFVRECRKDAGYGSQDVEFLAWMCLRADHTTENFTYIVSLFCCQLKVYDSWTVMSTELEAVNSKCVCRRTGS